MNKGHIRRWGNKWFVGWGYGSCVGCVFNEYRAACDFASHVTLKMRNT